MPVFIAEIAGPKRRAPLVSRNELMIVSGQLLAYVVSTIMSYTLHDPHIWRYMLALAMVPGILLFIGTFFVPASPHWLVSEGRFTEALKVLKSCAKRRARCAKRWRRCASRNGWRVRDRR